jgi:hypothetical protein
LSRIHDVIVASMLVGRDHLSLEEDDKGHVLVEMTDILPEVRSGRVWRSMNCWPVKVMSASK